MGMPAITLHAPWGSLIAAGFKTIETRSHNRFARLVGRRIAIHQGKGRAPLDQVSKWLRAVGASRAATWVLDYGARAPLGRVVATALVHAAGPLDGSIQTNMAAGLPTAGLYGLCLADIRAFEDPVQARGAQGIWTWDGDEPLPSEGVLDVEAQERRD